MKYIIIVVALISLIPSIASATIDQNLKYGMRNNEVTEMQEYLIDKGFLVAGSATGFFGPMTLKAVKSYQGSVGVITTGFVGPLTRTEMNKDLTVFVSEANQAEQNEVGSVTSITSCSQGSVFNAMTGERCDGTPLQPVVVERVIERVVEVPKQVVVTQTAPMIPLPMNVSVASVVQPRKAVCLYKIITGSGSQSYSYDPNGPANGQGIALYDGYITFSGLPVGGAKLASIEYGIETSLESGVFGLMSNRLLGNFSYPNSSSRVQELNDIIHPNINEIKFVAEQIKDYGYIKPYIKSIKLQDGTSVSGLPINFNQIDVKNCEI